MKIIDTKRAADVTERCVAANGIDAPLSLCDATVHPTVFSSPRIEAGGGDQAPVNGVGPENVGFTDDRLDCQLMPIEQFVDAGKKFSDVFTADQQATLREAWAIKCPLRRHDQQMADEEGYLLDNQQVEAGQRFDAFAELFDPSTFRHLTAVGLGQGWRVWEVGAGGRSVPAWLARQVGADGRVLATDIDTSWVSGTAGVEVLRHDVGLDPVPDGPFDLVHARLLLVHVPHRDRALAQMVAALRPGGWLVVEDADPALQPLVCVEDQGPAEKLANRLKAGFRQLLAARGVDLAYGRTLPRRLREMGLVDVSADAYFPIAGAACSELERATVEQIRDRLIAGGIATAAEIDEHLAAVTGGALDLATSPMISAWGRRRPEGRPVVDR
jgi:SAM-dependent methyltransferase